MNISIIALLALTGLPLLCHAEVVVKTEKLKSVPYRDAAPLTDYYSAGNQTFKVTVDTIQNRLNQEPLIERLKIDLLRMPKFELAENLLSEYARTWAKKLADISGPNCFHTSMASIFSGWKKHRYMSQSEFTCLLKNGFEEIDKPTKWGDLIGFFSRNGDAIHGFTYLGEDEGDKTQKIVFTKNGYGKSEYHFMTYDSVYGIYKPFGVEKISFYRPKINMTDPSEDKTSPCAVTWSTAPTSPSAGEIRDAIQDAPKLREMKN